MLILLSSSICFISTSFVLANPDVDVLAFKPGSPKSDLTTNGTGMAVLRQDSETIKRDVPAADEDASGTPSDESEITDASPSLLSSKFDQTYNFNLENGSILPIKYKISGGELTDVILEESRELDGNPTLVASITPTAPKGILLIELPRSLIDSKASSSDQPFYENKWDGMKSGKYKEIENNQWTRTLEIPFAISITGIGESTHVTIVGTEPKL